MKVITYLAFTVLSIFIQFCVMDLIQEKIQIKKPVFNVTSKKETLSDLLKNISSKPHAIYYRTIERSLKKDSELSIQAVPLGITDGTTTIFDVLYDENTSYTEATSTTTETYFTSTEFENITEITFFTPKNKTNIPSHTPKITYNTHCNCNLLYKVCDINCCCDQDCSDFEHNIFNCEGNEKAQNPNSIAIDGCVYHIFSDDHRYGSSLLDDMFCVVKTNLPNKHNIQKYDQGSVGHYYNWFSVNWKQLSYEFKKTVYKQADPVWLLKHGIIYYLDFPAPALNNYCNDRIPITFLKNEKVTCNVKFKELEMFNILNTSEEAMVISATNNTANSTDLNCSNLHCINWTILACNNGLCINYNQSLHEASCTDTSCTNIALKIDYLFYYSDLKIINATIKLYLQNITNSLSFMAQEVSVQFYIANISIDHVTELSGNPGYVYGLPVIASFLTSNYTENFFNRTSERRQHYISFPGNQNGLCMSSNSSNNVVKFGLNKRTKCRYVYPNVPITKNKLCNDIQNNINNLLGLNKNIAISPFGNPNDITDGNWISLNTDNKQEPVYGEFNDKSSKLHCYNLMNRVSLLFMYANVDEKTFKGQNKILFAKFEVTSRNLSFYTEDISTVLTIDTSFVDLTKPSLIEYAGSPHINIHLPKDFFFPFPKNSCFYNSNKCIVTIYCSLIIFLQIK